MSAPSEWVSEQLPRGGRGAVREERWPRLMAIRAFVRCF